MLKYWFNNYCNIIHLKIENIEKLMPWRQDGKFGNVGSVALQDLAKVPPGHSFLLCQLSLICALPWFTQLVHQICACLFNKVFCTQIFLHWNISSLNYLCTGYVHSFCEKQLEQNISALNMCLAFVHCNVLQCIYVNHVAMHMQCSHLCRPQLIENVHWFQPM